MTKAIVFFRNKQGINLNNFFSLVFIMCIQCDTWYWFFFDHPLRVVTTGFMLIFLRIFFPFFFIIFIYIFKRWNNIKRKSIKNYIIHGIIRYRITFYNYFHIPTLCMYNAVSSWSICYFVHITKAQSTNMLWLSC